MERLVQDTIVPYESIKISFLNSNETPCQIGKLIHNMLPAAFSSALSMALSKPVSHIPCTEQELFELTKAKPDENTETPEEENSEAREESEEKTETESEAQK